MQPINLFFNLKCICAILLIMSSIKNGTEHNSPWLAFIGISTMAFIGFVDYTIVALALPNIQHDLSVPVIRLQWVMNIYGVMLAALMTIMGKLADKFGHRLFFYSGCFIFSLASLGAGLSNDFYILIVFRAIQGVCGAILFPVAASLISTHFKDEKTKQKALGIYSSISGLGLATGPLLGGFIIEYLSWRWVFFINIPVCFIGFIICLPTVKKSMNQVIDKIDWLGTLCLFITVICLMLGSLRFQNTNGGDTLTIFYLCIALIGLVLFYKIEKSSSSPLFNLHLFTESRFYAGVAICFLMGGLSLCFMFFDVLYMKNIRHMSSISSGILLSIIPLAIILFSPIIMRLGQRYSIIKVITSAIITCIFATLLHFTINLKDSPWWLSIPFIFLGYSWATAIIMSTNAAQKSVPADQIAVATAMTYSFWNISSSVILVLSTVIFHLKESSWLQQLLLKHNILLSSKKQALIKTLVSNPQHAHQALMNFNTNLHTKILYFFNQAFMHGFYAVVWLLLTLCCITLLSLGLVYGYDRSK